MLTLGISPCPNDTFAFHHLLQPPCDYRVTLDDVEALNRGEFDVTKISVAGFGHLRKKYALLRSGGAAGFGVGPLLVAARKREAGGRIAIPGRRTTAALLLRLLGDFETVEMRFDTVARANPWFSSMSRAQISICTRRASSTSTPFVAHHRNHTRRSDA